MAINEVFSNPTVKQVIFQIRFPNLFSMEKMIGDYQVEIMDSFPNSQLLFQQSFVMANVGPKTDLQEVQDKADSVGIKKIWNFRSDTGVELNVHTDSMDISSTLHKTYNNQSEDNRFRDTIAFAVDKFLKIVHVPKLARIGLRYIDKCPIQSRDSNTFQQWYNSTFPLKRFPLETATDLNFTARVEKDGCFLKFSEIFHDDGKELKFTLDFDGYALNIESGNYLSITDKLHDLISNEFEASAKKPLFDYMRTKKE